MAGKAARVDSAGPPRSELREKESGVGPFIESLTRRRHRRRIRDLGWEEALNAPPGSWATSGSPVREGNEIEILIDGAAVLPAILEAISRARSHVHLGFWTANAEFELSRGEGAVTLREALAEAAERVDVRYLMWASARVPWIHPSRGDARRTVRALMKNSRVQAAIDDPERWTASYHEKIVVVDSSEAFVGGLDPSWFHGDRYDAPTHPPRPEGGWHDVAARVRGPVVADVSRHFAQRWHAATSQRLPDAPTPAPAGPSRAQLVRTVATGRFAEHVNGDFSAMQAHLAALRSAERLIYIENQYLWSLEIVDVLADKLINPPRDDFRLVLLLPVHPRSGYDDTRGQLSVLQRADDGAGRLVASSLYSQGPDPVPVYVHSKLVMVDDRWLSVGSMNLSDHGMFNDVDVQLVSDDPDVARSTRARLWAEHLDMTEEEVRRRDPVELIDDGWKPPAREQLERQQRGEPLTARLVELEPVSKPTARILGALQGLLLAPG